MGNTWGHHMAAIPGVRIVTNTHIHIQSSSSSSSDGTRPPILNSHSCFQPMWLQNPMLLAFHLPRPGGLRAVPYPGVGVWSAAHGPGAAGRQLHRH